MGRPRKRSNDETQARGGKTTWNSVRLDEWAERESSAREHDAPEFSGRDVNRMAATGELNLRTWLDD